VTNNNATPTSTPTTYESHNMPVINPQRMVNGTVTINGHYQTNPNLPSRLFKNKNKIIF
jgi:hypothetical protein